MIGELYCVECGEHVDPWVFGSTATITAMCYKCGSTLLEIEGGTDPDVMVVGS